MPPARKPRASRPAATKESTADKSAKTTKGRGRPKKRELHTETAPDDLEATPPPAYNALQKAVSECFQAAQKTTSAHRKLVANLKYIHESCVKGTGVGEEFGGGRQGEKAFCKEFMRVLSRVLVVPKKELVADRCIRFAERFAKFLVEKDPPPKDEEGNVVRNETYRFILYLLKCLYQLIKSKDKNVRYRTIQLIALLLVETLPIFPYEQEYVFLKKLTNRLRKRMVDKEQVVRLQSALALTQILALGLDVELEEDEEDDEQSSADEEEHDTLLSQLCHAMIHDPSAEVRRGILLSMPKSGETFQHSRRYILERARDVDQVTRRSIYTRVLPDMGDFRLMSEKMRTNVLLWGVTDRDTSVRLAAQKMFSFTWIEMAGGDITEVLMRLDLTNLDEQQQEAMETAMKGLWADRGDLVEATLNSMDKQFWDELSVEGAFIARSLSEYCRENKMDDLLEDKMPEVTPLAMYMQNNLNKLVEIIRESQDIENAITDQTFTCEQLLTLASNMDYGDEVGRRKMFALMRDSLALYELPDVITRLIVEVLAKISLGEKDFCMIVMEVIAEIQDQIEPGEDENQEEGSDDDSFHSAVSDVEDEEDPAAPAKKRRKLKAKTAEEEQRDEEKALRDIGLQLKSLFIAQCMLENVEGNLMQNMHLVTALNGLVVPAVRSHEASVRELGLRCLGLSCLITKTLAVENFTLFAHCFNKGHEELQVEAVHIISDILMVHGATIFDEEDITIEKRTLFRMFSKALKLSETPEVQAAVGEALCKLMLAQIIDDEELLKSLILAFFDPANSGNYTLRQTLNYFLPVYARMSVVNLQHMTNVAVSTIHTLFQMSEDNDGDTDMVTGQVYMGMILEWCDPRRNVAMEKLDEDEKDEGSHVQIARELLELVTGKCPKEERKLLIHVLPKLYIPSSSKTEDLQTIYELTVKALNSKTISDATSKNHLNKFEVILQKLLVDAEEGHNDDGDDDREKGQQGGKDDLEDETVVPEKGVETEAEKIFSEEEGEKSEVEVDDGGAVSEMDVDEE